MKNIRIYHPKKYNDKKYQQEVNQDAEKYMILVIE